MLFPCGIQILLARSISALNEAQKKNVDDNVFFTKCDRLNNYRQFPFQSARF